MCLKTSQKRKICFLLPRGSRKIIQHILESINAENQSYEHVKLSLNPKKKYFDPQVISVARFVSDYRKKHGTYNGVVNAYKKAS